MTINLHKWSIILLLLILFPSCKKTKNVNRDVLIEEIMDSLHIYREKQDGERIIFWLDSLKVMEINMQDISLEYADAYAYIGNFEKAIGVLKDSVSFSKNPQLLYNEMGSIYLLKGDTANAILAYKQAINCNPNYARPYIYLGDTYSHMDENELAINYYLSATRLFAENRYYEEMGSYASKALMIDSTNIEANKFLQHYYYSKNDHKMALAVGLAIYELCVEQNQLEEGYANMVFMGMSLFELKEYEKSISLMHQAINDKKTTKEYGYLICCYVSASYRELGDDKKADYFLSLAKEVNAEDAEKYINELLNRGNENK